MWANLDSEWYPVVTFQNHHFLDIFWSSLPGLAKQDLSRHPAVVKQLRGAAYQQPADRKMFEASAAVLPENPCTKFLTIFVDHASPQSYKFFPFQIPQTVNRTEASTGWQLACPAEKNCDSTNRTAQLNSLQLTCVAKTTEDMMN